MTMEDLEVLNEFLERSFGIVYPEHKLPILESRLTPRMNALGLHSYTDYYLMLQYDSGKELPHLARAVTNNETYFFRETAQIEALFTIGIDEVKANATMPNVINLLSAGCSSGEEAYTISIIAKENLFRMWGYSVEIDAFDLDDSRIEIARKAAYGPNSFRGVEPTVIEKCFSTSDGEGLRRLRPLFRTGVSFRVGNLLEAATYRRGLAYDAIFCRNVLIYFSEPALRATVENFAAALRPGGLLFLGHSESLVGITDAFEISRLGDAIAYRRTG
jgi:chemotaxis protein methyltransferase CheR